MIPPDESLAIINRYRNIDPMEAMIPILQEIQTKYGFITEAVANQMAEELEAKHQRDLWGDHLLQLLPLQSRMAGRCC